ncbi:MAG: RraA family protein [Planctomycetota bacterium]|nr:RraA family protein [Planctomycetota bacterium]MDA1138173.1 RraA family protein [Planctomycetota bacterium]
MNFDSRDDIIQLSPLWEGDRFPNGRPKVPSELLHRLERLTTEEAWSRVWSAGYKFQFQGDFKTTHPGRNLVGRAVTAVMVPQRPDLHDFMLKHGHEQEGRKGYFNQWVIDSLEEDDVVVVDMFDKIFQGTYVGGNLSTAIAARTRRGAVIWGGIRDLQQIEEIENIQIYHRGNDPTGIADVTMVGMNVPCRIGKAICMPGDVVLGTSSGVLFIPPHLADSCAVHGEKMYIRDLFGLGRVRAGIYSTAQIDGGWTVAIWDDFMDWFKNDAPKEYHHLTWDDELAGARKQAEKGPSSDVRL